MNINELVRLVSNASEGKQDIGKSSIGFNGFGFVFRNPMNSTIPYVKTIHSSKFCTVNLILKRNFFQWWNPKEVSREKLYDYLIDEEKYYILLAGSLKTLVPTLKFGGYELLFDVWMFVKMPDGGYFPATFYYGQSGASLGGWDSYKDDSGRSIFPKGFEEVVNLNPFKFSDSKLKELVKALEQALRRVSVSDFYGVYRHDLGNTLMGIKRGRPFLSELYGDPDEERIRNLVRLK